MSISKLDEIVLVPANWKYDDYKKSIKGISDIITDAMDNSHLIDTVCGKTEYLNREKLTNILKEKGFLL